MARIIICDGGCGAQSPDRATGLHDANRWLHVRAWHGHQNEPSEYDDKLFCINCAGRVLTALCPQPKDTP